MSFSGGYTKQNGTKECGQRRKDILNRLHSDIWRGGLNCRTVIFGGLDRMPIFSHQYIQFQCYLHKTNIMVCDDEIAQFVERILHTDEVVGPSPTLATK